MKKTSLLILLCSLLTGCGLQFTYNQLDWLGRWYVNSYVSLSGPQKTEFRRRWNAQLDWHRQTELARYATLLKDFQTAVNSGIRMDHLQEFSEQTEELYRSTMAHLAPDLLYFATQANSQQSQQLLDSMAKKNRKWAKKFVTPDAHKKDRRRIRNTTERIEEWTGPLSIDQRNRVRRWNGQLLPVAEEMLAQRIKWHRLLETYLANRTSLTNQTRPVALQPQPLVEDTSLATLLTDPKQLWSEQYHSTIEHNKAATLGLVLDLFSGLSNKQTKHLNKKLHNTIEDLEQLSTKTNTQLTQNQPFDESYFTNP